MALNMRGGQALHIGAVNPSSTKIPIPDPTALGLLAYSYPGYSKGSGRSSADKPIKLEGLPIQEIQIRQLNRQIEVKKQNLASYAKEKLMDEYHGDASAFMKGEQKKGDQGYFAKRQEVLAMEDMFMTNVSQAKRSKEAYNSAWKSAEKDQALDQFWYDDYGRRMTMNDKGDVIPEGHKEDKNNGYFTVGQWIKMGEIAPLGASTGLVEPYNYGQHIVSGKANTEIDAMLKDAKSIEVLAKFNDGSKGTRSSNESAIAAIPKIARQQMTRQGINELRDNFNREFPGGFADEKGKPLQINGKDVTRDQAFEIYLTKHVSDRAGLGLDIKLTKASGSGADGDGSGMDRMNIEQFLQDPKIFTAMAGLQGGTLTVDAVDVDATGKVSKVQTKTPTEFVTEGSRGIMDYNSTLYKHNNDGTKSYYHATNTKFINGWTDASGTVHGPGELPQSRVLGYTGRIVKMPKYYTSPVTGKRTQSLVRDSQGNVQYEYNREYEISLSEDDWHEGTAFKYYKSEADGTVRKEGWQYGRSWAFGGDNNKEDNITRDLGGRKLTNDEYSSFSKTSNVSMYAIKAYEPMNPMDVIQLGNASLFNGSLYGGINSAAGYGQPDSDQRTVLSTTTPQ